MIFMGSLSGRGSPARPEGLEAWLTSDPAPPRRPLPGSDVRLCGDRPPFQSLAAAQVSQILSREADLLRLGETSVDEAIATIQEEGQAALDEVATCNSVI